MTANFDGGTLTTDGGGLLLRKTEKRNGLMKRVLGCVPDGRQAGRIEHPLEEMLAQRIYGLALGYEDLNDHEQLRHDPLLGIRSGKKSLQAPLAGKSTLNRLELTPEGDARQQRYHKIGCSSRAIDELSVSPFQEVHVPAPRRIVLDLDAADTPVHGHQESRFFHGSYNHDCYLRSTSSAVIICCGRACGQPTSTPARAAWRRSRRWWRRSAARRPKTQIILRADSGFYRDELMAWCERSRGDDVFGFARNERLRKLIEAQIEQARAEHERTGQQARVFAEFDSETRDTWSRARRVVAKAKRIEGKENPRFVVTSLGVVDFPAQALSERLYCPRGEMENRTKEQLSLFANRLSTETMRAKRLRLCFSWPQSRRGRHPQHHFRGLLRLHSRSSLSGRSPAL